MTVVDSRSFLRAGIEEAPTDSDFYGRRNLQWNAISAPRMWVTVTPPVPLVTGTEVGLDTVAIDFLPGKIAFDPGTGRFTLPMGHVYIAKFFYVVDYAGQNDDHEFQWYSVTDAAYVGLTSKGFAKLGSQTLPAIMLVDGTQSVDTVLECRTLTESGTATILDGTAEIELLHLGGV